MSEKPKMVREQVQISKAADDLLRTQFKRKGDLSKAVEYAIWNTYGPEKPITVPTQE